MLKKIEISKSLLVKREPELTLSVIYSAPNQLRRDPDHTEDKNPPHTHLQEPPEHHRTAMTYTHAK